VVNVGFFDWLKTLFASNAPSQSEKKHRTMEEDDEEEIEELVALDII
jgi:hypothetical protein